MRGLDTRSAAERLFITPHTVQYHDEDEQLNGIDVGGRRHVDFHAGYATVRFDPLDGRGLGGRALCQW